MARKFEIQKVPSTAFDTPVVFTDQDRKVMPFGFLATYREMGWKNYRRAQYEPATRNFNIAMGFFPEDRRTVIGRGYSRSRNMLFEGALKDAETILKQNEFDKEAIYLQALSQYELGDFEKGLVAFHKGTNKRGKRPEFRDGRYQAEGTIEDCIGRYAGPMLTDMKAAIKKMLEKIERNRIKKEHESKYIDNLDISPPHPCTDYEWNRYCKQQNQLNSVMAEIYLGKLNCDRKWLSETLDNPDVRSVNKKGTDKLLSLARKAVDDINKRLEILRSRRPYYHIRFKIEQTEEGFRKQKIKLEKRKAAFLKCVAEDMLRDIQKERFLKNTKRCLQIVYRAKLHLDKAAQRLLPEKGKYLNTLYNLAGLAYLDLKKFKMDLSDRHNYQRIFYMLGFDPIFNDQKIDPIVQESTFPFADYKTVMKIAKNYLELADTDLERAWLHYEIGRCYGEQQKWEHMVLRGKKCTNAAKRCYNLVWIINGLFMVVTGEMRNKNKEDALMALNDCTDHALKYKDESVIKFLYTCADLLKEKEVLQEALLDSNMIIKKREDFIISLMSDIRMKNNTHDLFRRMSVLPANRRMSLIPGIKPKNAPGYNPGSKSIIPGGTGGRLSLNPCGKITYKEFLELA